MKRLIIKISSKRLSSHSSRKILTKWRWRHKVSNRKRTPIQSKKNQVFCSISVWILDNEISFADSIININLDTWQLTITMTNESFRVLILALSITDAPLLRKNLLLFSVRRKKQILEKMHYNRASFNLHMPGTYAAEFEFSLVV